MPATLSLSSEPYMISRQHEEHQNIYNIHVLSYIMLSQIFSKWLPAAIFDFPSTHFCYLLFSTLYFFSFFVIDPTMCEKQEMTGFI